jgi:hypothetical protein
MTLLSLKKYITRAITSSLASLVLVALKTLGLLKKNPCSNFQSLLLLDHFGLKISTTITCRILSSPGHQGLVYCHWVGSTN